jgi:thiamine kinase-like enzyme
MTDVVDVVVERLWPGKPRRIQRLEGGITNANFRVEVGDECVVVRVPGAQTELLGIDRRSEAAATRLAAAIGVGPEVVTVVEDPWCLVTRFIAARPIDRAELAAEPMLGQVIATLRRVHGAGTIPTTFDYFAVIGRYHAEASQRGVSEPFDFTHASAVMQRIAAARPFRPTVLGHNDLLNANFLYDGAVRILDWEYAGMTDPFFDLANLSVNHGFPPERDEALLEHYFGRCDDGLRAVLGLMKMVSELREAMWGVIQMAISDLDVDYGSYAAERAVHFESLVAGDDFAHLLAMATPSADGPPTA